MKVAEMTLCPACRSSRTIDPGKGPLCLDCGTTWRETEDSWFRRDPDVVDVLAWESLGRDVPV